jgi:DNA polymerase III sliding clamp (beta) subunit (PCNA family)
MTSEESRSVDFAFSGNLLALSTPGTEAGDARIEVDTDYAGTDPLTIRMDGRFLADGLKAIEEDTPITLDLIDEKNLVAVRSGDGFCYLIPPIGITK